MRGAPEITTQAVSLHFVEHLDNFLETTKKAKADEEDSECKKMLQLQVKKLVMFKHLFKTLDPITKHYWLWSQFKIGWTGCQRLQIASAEDIFFEVQADLLEKELQECLHNSDGGEVSHEAAPADSQGHLLENSALAGPASADAENARNSAAGAAADA